MPNPLSQLQDRTRISVSQPHELRAWAERLACTPQELLDAIAAVGSSSQRVRHYLHGLPRHRVVRS